MNKLIGALATLLAAGCYVETDTAIPIKENTYVPSDEKEETQQLPRNPEGDVDAGNCENAYEVLVFHEETTNADIIVLIPIPCDPRPFIDLGRPAPIAL